MIRRFRLILLFFGLTLGIALLISSQAPADGKGATTCKAGKVCACDGVNACSRSCTGSGCKFESHGVGARTFRCKGGGCAVDSDATGATTLYCEGGGCTMTCTGAGTCSLLKCTKDCTLDCRGVGACTKGE